MVQSSVIVLEVLILGRTPTAIVIDGLKVPLYNSFPAPDEVLTIPKCVSAAPGEAVHSPKSTLTGGDTELPVTVNPAPDLAAATRA